MEAQSYTSLLHKLKLKSELKQTSCEYCLREITSCTYIKCAECNNLTLCIYCYSEGKQEEEHQISHSYKVVDPLNFPLFESDWPARLELMLFEGTLKYGFGNWCSISDYLMGAKTPWECEKHYKQVYLGKFEEDLQNLAILTSRTEEGFLYLDKTVTNEFADLAEDAELLNEPPPVPEKHPLAEFAGYMPLREDFEVEYENDFEMFLAELEFFEDDKNEDQEIKLKELHIYNKILDEREERKEFIINRWPREIRNERKYKENMIERTIYCAMKPYARLLPPDEFDSLVEGLIKEYELKLQLEDLLEAHSQGIEEEEEFEEFLKEKRSSTKARECENVFRPVEELVREAEIVLTEGDTGSPQEGTTVSPL